MDCAAEIETDFQWTAPSEEYYLLRELLSNLQRGICAYCGEKIFDPRHCIYCKGRVCAMVGGCGPTIDHVIPKCRGGRGKISNLAYACKACNLNKGDTAAMPVFGHLKLDYIGIAKFCCDAGRCELKPF